VRPKPLDIIIIIVAVAAVVSTAVFAVGARGGEGEGLVKSDGGEFVYSLEREGTVELEGPIGITTIAIRDGAIRVVDSPCRDKTCITRGWLSAPGDWTACLPNRVFVQVRSIETGDAPDTVSH
jgi:hypothetical protein